MQKKNREELNEVHKKFKLETSLKNVAIQNLENMRQEIQALETTSNQTNWKEKSQELYDICVQIKEENSYLVERCKQIAALAVNMMNQLNEQKPQAQPLVEPDLSKLTENLKNARRQSRDLPKLMASQQLLSLKDHSLLLDLSREAKTNMDYPIGRAKKHNRGRSLLDIKNEITSA